MPSSDPSAASDGVRAAEPAAGDLAVAHAELSRLKQNAFWLRMGTVIASAALIALFSVRERPRFMFVVPFVTTLLWALDGGVTRGARVMERILGAMRDPQARRTALGGVDVAPLRLLEPLWRNVLHPRVAVVYYPVTLVAALIAVDAPVIAPDDRPSELAWYALVAGCALFAALLSAIAALTEAAAAETATAASRAATQRPLNLPLPTVLPGVSPAALPLATNGAGPFQPSPGVLPGVLPRVQPGVQPGPSPVAGVRKAPPETAPGPFPPSAGSLVPPAPRDMAQGETRTVAHDAPVPTGTAPTGTVPTDTAVPRSDPTHTFGTLIE